VGYTLPPEIAEVYEVRVEEASAERLVITAVSEVRGRAGDFLSVDQDYKIQANFQLPAPRPEFLKAQAMRHLRVLRELGITPSRELQEKGIFQGFFRYELKRSSQNLPVARAVGTRPPVRGVELEFDGSESDASVSVELAQEAASTGGTGEQSKARDIKETLEEAYLAQQIFRGETGRYARNWEELTRISSFRFSPQELGRPGTSAPFAGRGDVIDLEAEVAGSAAREPATHAPNEALVVEPVEAEPLAQ
jgi:hypothetical protein